MSYLRINSPYVYVEGFSDDYVFESWNKKGSKIIDYGSMSNKSIVELLTRFGNEGDLILLQMGKRLAENLKIKLRKKSLTDKQWLKLFNRKQKELTKKFAKTMSEVKK